MKIIHSVLYRLIFKILPDHARMTPIASTVPGKEYGSVAKNSKAPFPFGLILMITYAIITPSNIAKIPELTARIKELETPSRTILLLNKIFV